MNNINRLNEQAEGYTRRIDHLRARIEVLKHKRKRVNKKIRRIVRRLTR